MRKSYAKSNHKVEFPQDVATGPPDALDAGSKILNQRKNPSWNKQSTEPTSSAQQREPIRMPPPNSTPAAPAAPVTMSGPKQSAVIGPSMTIKGEIRAREELLVDGDVEGILES